MIYIFSAFYAEAKNIIDHYDLKKEKSLETVRFDVFANESIRLVITGRRNQCCGSGFKYRWCVWDFTG